MTGALAKKTCIPCRGGVLPLDREAATRLHQQVPDWALLDDARKIERKFTFRNFRAALAFVDAIGAVAEAQDHHPDIAFGWGYATVSLHTHKIKGLHENDFIMAAKVDRIFAATQG
jgi:4a-hydroxytetrahydrobiopterin dehydratase